MIATTGSDAKFAAARELGADEVINYETTNVGDAVMALTGGLGVDIALDMVGGARLHDCIAPLALGGRIVSVGAHGGEHVDIDMIELFRKHISLHGCGRSTRAIVAKVLDSGRGRAAQAGDLQDIRAGGGAARRIASWRAATSSAAWSWIHGAPREDDWQFCAACCSVRRTSRARSRGFRSSGADAVVLDLEDAVADAQKVAARRSAREALPTLIGGVRDACASMPSRPA